MLPPLHIPDTVRFRATQLADALRTDWRGILSDEEMDRRRAMNNEERRKSFTAGRVVLRSLLADELGLAPSHVPLIVQESGRLACEDHDLHLSLAHSGQLAIAAISHNNIGCDLEVIRHKPSSLLDYILADEEREHVHGLPLDTDQSLFLCWTVKEAVLKATGTGLRRSPRSVRARFDLNRSLAHVQDSVDAEWEVHFALSSQYAAALAVQPG